MEPVKRRNLTPEDRARRAEHARKLAARNKLRRAGRSEREIKLSELRAVVDGVSMPFAVAEEELIQATLLGGRPGPDAAYWRARCYSLREQLATVLAVADRIRTDAPPGELIPL